MFFIFLLCLLLFKPGHIKAEGEFSISQNIVYTVNQNGLAVVQNKVSLQNNFSEIYPQQYIFSLGQTGLQNISANDTGGNIIDSVNIDDQSTKIYLKFNQPGVGKDQITQFTIHYQIPDFAQKKGKLYEISLPIYQSSDQDINIQLKIPKNFGKLAFSSVPANTLQHHDDLYDIINLNHLKDQKILLIFGEYQFFDFELKYFLDNENSYPINTEIALPPDTNSQTINFTNINPLPLYINQDQSGNWLAQYQINPHQSLDILVQGQAKIHPPVSEKIDINFPDYLTEQPFWPVTNDQIRTIAANLKTARQVYDYVVSNLNYDYDRINSAQRKGALLALQQPNNSLCTEFTDLFVTLARAANIPSREIQGFAYTTDPSIKPVNQNADILHAWPQYFNQSTQTWISVDPTWGNTTQGIDFFSDLDLNHLTFVIHDLESNYPHPPGSYKKTADTKTVSVTFSPKEPQPLTIQALQVQAKNRSAFATPNLLIKNPNLTSVQNITINSDQLNWQHTIATIPPLGQIELTPPSANFLTALSPNYRYFEMIISQPDQNQTQKIKNPTYLINLFIFLSCLIFIISTSCIILIAIKKRQT